MRELTYFNLGYRSNTIFSYLIKDASTISNYHIVEARKIIKDCLYIESIDSVVRNFSSSYQYNAADLTPIVFKVYPNTSVKDIVESLKKMMESLLKLENHQNTTSDEIDKLCDFFKKVAKISRRYSDEIIRSRNLERTSHVPILGNLPC